MTTLTLYGTVPMTDVNAFDHAAQVPGHVAAGPAELVVAVLAEATLDVGQPVFQVGLTFLITLAGWVFFRATDLGQAGRFLAAMVGSCDGDIGSRRFSIDQMQWLALGACAFVAWFLPNSNRVARERTPWIVIGAALIFPLAVCHLYFQRYSPFLYFQF